MYWHFENIIYYRKSDNLNMRRINAALFSVITIIVVLFIIGQAGEIGAPWPLTLVAIAIIILILISLIRTWLRG
jgi:hypothetical protein